MLAHAENFGRKFLERDQGMLSGMGLAPPWHDVEGTGPDNIGRFLAKEVRRPVSRIGAGSDPPLFPNGPHLSGEYLGAKLAPNNAG